MIWHIAKRELYDNLNSLRFAIATLLMLSLMLTNAVVHLREHPGRVQRYRTSTTNALSILRDRTDLYDIAQKGPGHLYKKPSPLRFCAEGNEDFLSDTVDGGYYSWETDDLKGFWMLRYPAASPNLNNINPDITKVDWNFIIGIVLSLIALLFTFDTISGERERGTLRLTLANSIPRHTVLIGKFLGEFISINIPFTLALLVNLLVISTSTSVHLNAEAWGRLGIIFVIALLYTCLFLGLGLLISACAQQSAVSLTILLLTWVCFVVFIPRTLPSIAGGFLSPMSTDELSARLNQLHDEHWEKYRSRLWRGDESYSRILAQSEYVINDSEQEERLYQEHLTQQIAQVQHARGINRISPASIFQHLLESFAGTGLERHMQFLENAQRYARQYRQFIIDIDTADPQSLHLIGVREGMSQHPVRPEALPRFEDTFSLSKDFDIALTALLLLTMFIVVLLAGAHLAFVQAEV